jgi:RNA polymerase sporulation-specific sigma factor
LKTFEKPLTEKEEAQFLAIMNGSGMEYSKQEACQARQILIERNLRLVAHVAKKYAGYGEDLEDLISIGTIGLIKAVNTYKPDKGSRLATYAARCIDNELLMLFRSKKRTGREVSLYEPIGTDKEGNEISIIDICEQEGSDIIDDMDTYDKINYIVFLINERLDEREREIIRLRYGIHGSVFVGDEVTQKDIGKKLGISRSYVSRIEKKALEKLRMGLLEKKLC